jgi:hypothetical protein
LIPLDQLGYVSSWVGRRSPITLFYTEWCGPGLNYLIDIQLHNIWHNNSIPVISWEIRDCRGDYKPGVIKLVNNGTYDLYINQFGDRLKAWLAGKDSIYGTDDDRRAYLRLGMKYGTHTSSSLYLYRYKIRNMKSIY